MPKGQQRGNRIRIRFWNVAETIGDVCRQGVGEGWDPGVLEGAEVLRLAETGFDKTSQEAEVASWCQGLGWERVVCSMCPHVHQHGGVAVFVKRGQRAGGEAQVRRVEAGLVRDSPELWLAWLRVRTVGGQWLYIGAVYLPPKLSTYHAREEGNLIIQKHWWALQEGVLEMKQKGQVVLVGDV